MLFLLWQGLERRYKNAARWSRSAPPETAPRWHHGLRHSACAALFVHSDAHNRHPVNKHTHVTPSKPTTHVTARQRSLPVYWQWCARRCARRGRSPAAWSLHPQLSPRLPRRRCLVASANVHGDLQEGPQAQSIRARTYDRSCSPSGRSRAQARQALTKHARVRTVATRAPPPTRGKNARLLSTNRVCTRSRRDWRPPPPLDVSRSAAMICHNTPATRVNLRAAAAHDEARERETHRFASGSVRGHGAVHMHKVTQYLWPRRNPTSPATADTNPTHTHEPPQQCARQRLSGADTPCGALVST